MATFETTIDVMNPIWNRDAWARLQGNLDSSKTKFIASKGTVMGVEDGKAVYPMCGFEATLATRLEPQEDGTIRRINRETIIYTDARTGEIINEWTDPETKEVVPVVHVYNDPFNYSISEWLIIMPEDFGGDKPVAPIKVPLIFPWRDLGNGMMELSTDMHLYYPNQLQPAQWPRESSGPMVQVSEMMRYQFKKADIENPELTGVDYTGSWSRVTPWLPWMLRGTKPGHVLYMGSNVCSDNTDIFSANIRAHLEANAPEFLTAPDSDYGPSLSSLEHYAKEQTPAPVK
ncbi:DUF1838 family protein [Oceanicoccus sp. KOV_DT_Chl]|uniref:DUF1838 family protein n=1 Tax=Oceanicoccus sp. KOV_DT_Chl TaxID=1904639 RepID=UPI000C7A7F84|nr:DUF1838 family protein [Oceanicoccus sp. KOV_DT_Chl]